MTKYENHKLPFVAVLTSNYSYLEEMYQQLTNLPQHQYHLLMEVLPLLIQPTLKFINGSTHNTNNDIELILQTHATTMKQYWLQLSSLGTESTTTKEFREDIIRIINYMIQYDILKKNDPMVNDMQIFITLNNNPNVHNHNKVSTVK